MVFVSLISLNWETLCDLTVVKASIYDRKTADRLFDTLRDILLSLGLVQRTLMRERFSDVNIIILVLTIIL